MTMARDFEPNVVRRACPAVRLLRRARDEWAVGSEEWLTLALLVYAVEALDEAAK